MSPAKSIGRRNRPNPGVPSPTAVRIQAPVALPPSDGVTSYTWVWYLLSVFVPFAGILIALFLYDQDNWNVRKIGRNCLLIAFMLWVLFPIIVFMGILLIAVLAVAGTVSNAISPTD